MADSVAAGRPRMPGTSACVRRVSWRSRLRRCAGSERRGGAGRVDAVAIEVEQAEVVDARRRSCEAPAGETGAVAGCTVGGEVTTPGTTTLASRRPAPPRIIVVTMVLLNRGAPHHLPVTRPPRASSSSPWGSRTGGRLTTFLSPAPHLNMKLNERHADARSSAQQWQVRSLRANRPPPTRHGDRREAEGDEERHLHRHRQRRAPATEGLWLIRVEAQTQQRRTIILHLRLDRIAEHRPRWHRPLIDGRLHVPT